MHHAQEKKTETWPSDLLVVFSAGSKPNSHNPGQQHLWCSSKIWTKIAKKQFCVNSHNFISSLSSMPNCFQWIFQAVVLLHSWKSVHGKFYDSRKKNRSCKAFETGPCTHQFSVLHLSEQEQSVFHSHSLCVAHQKNQRFLLFHSPAKNYISPDLTREKFQTWFPRFLAVSFFVTVAIGKKAGDQSCTGPCPSKLFPDLIVGQRKKTLGSLTVESFDPIHARWHICRTETTRGHILSKHKTIFGFLSEFPVL